MNDAVSLFTAMASTTGQYITQGFPFVYLFLGTLLALWFVYGMILAVSRAVP